MILSPNFFAKNWPRRELDALAAREVRGSRKVILPVWHNVTARDVEQHSPTLAAKLAVSTAKGIHTVVDEITNVLGQATDQTGEENAGISGKAVDQKRMPVPVELEITHRELRIGQDRHDYRLVIKARNVGSEVLRSYYVEIIIPTLVVDHVDYARSAVIDLMEPLVRSLKFVRTTRGGHGLEKSLFRGEFTEPFYPDPEHWEILAELDYCMDHDIYCNHRQVLTENVRATLYANDYAPVSAEVLFDALECF